MLTLIQRVTHASVKIDAQITAQVHHGLLILCGFETNDTIENSLKLIEKCFHYRIFSDENDKMNLNLIQSQGQALLVPQFTLVADTQRGLRPSFSKGMPPQEGKQLFLQLRDQIISQYPHTQFGQFGADMKIDLCNDGPVTFLLQG